MQCASSQFDPEVAERLSFSTGDMVDFSPGYLCGYFAEAPDMDSNKEHSDLEEFTERQYAIAIGKEVKQTITTVELPPKVQDDADLVLLPVWLLAERDGERVLYTAINGLDGRIICDTPVAPRRAYGLALLLGALFAALFMIFSGAIILRGKLVAGLCAVLASAGYFFVSRTLRNHRSREERLQEQRTIKRCQLLKSEHIQKATAQYFRQVSDGSGFFADLVHEVPLLLLSVLVIGGFGLLGALLINGGDPSSIFPAGVILLPLSVCWYVVLEKTRHNRTISNPFSEWFLLYFLKASIVAVVIYVVMALDNQNSAIAGLVSDRGWLPPYLCLFSLLVMLFSSPGAHCGAAHLTAYALETVLIALAGASMFTVFDQRRFYLIAILIMLVMMYSISLVIRHHNQFVTRPVPFFGRKEDVE